MLNIKNFVLPFLIAAAVIVWIPGCSEDSIIEPDPPSASTLPVDTARNIPADTMGNTGSFTYYSLRTKSVITGDDTLTDKWDIAFRTTTIYVNGGVLHPAGGQGGAIVTGANAYISIYPLSNFDTISVAPVSGYGVDTSAGHYAVPSGSGNGWYSYDFANNYIAPIPGRIILLKTGDGKYAKLEILSYYKDMDPQPMPNPLNSRWYTFRFSIQTDGSTRLK